MAFPPHVVGTEGLLGVYESAIPQGRPSRWGEWTAEEIAERISEIVGKAVVRQSPIA